jgi:predicted alpha/beta-hydrolase family hydrolase
LPGNQFLPGGRFLPRDHFLIDEPAGVAQATLVLAHGAGAPMDSRPLDLLAKSLVRLAIRVVRFEFPYMRLRRTGGRRKPPDPPNVLLQSWRSVIEELGGGPSLFIGGKSMGGRIASMVADEAKVRGLVCLGYPFHPPAKPAQLRTAHLKALETPALILQGERDPFGGAQEVPRYDLSPNIQIVWIADGDHSFKPRKQSGRTEAENLEHAVAEIVRFITKPLHAPRR